MRHRKNMGHSRKNNIKPLGNVLQAMWDKDPNALLLDTTPVDLSVNLCCPVCGYSKEKRHEG